MMHGWSKTYIGQVSIWFASGNMMKGGDRKHLCFVVRAVLTSATRDSGAGCAAETASRETRRLKSISSLDGFLTDSRKSLCDPRIRNALNIASYFYIA